jgi:hypothetical protein
MQVGLDAHGLVDAGVGEDAVHAVQAQPLAQVRVLGTLGVERADQQDRVGALHFASSPRWNGATLPTASGGRKLVIG